jgi:hypothetical protein
MCSLSVQRVDARNPKDPPPPPPRESSLPEEREHYARYVHGKVSSAVLKQLSQALVERHRALFGFLLVVHGMRIEGRISEAEWRVFVLTNSDPERSDIHELMSESPRSLASDQAVGIGASTWIASTSWKSLNALCSALPHLAGLISEDAPHGLQQADSEWR